MRIKLNITQLIPDRYPSVYWLHVDVTHILLIKQLKEKVRKVLKESRDIELYFDNLPFLDEDDITAINENEEITVIMKERTNYTGTNNTQTDSNIAYSNSIMSMENLVFKPVINDHSSTPSIVQNNSRKRLRKRTYKKKNQSEIAEPNNKDCLYSVPIHTPSNESNKIHKRFKLENEENDQKNISSSSDDSVHIIGEIIRCDSPFHDSPKNQPYVQKQKPFSPKVMKVPVFERNKKCTPNNTKQNGVHTLNGMDKNDETTSNENYDIMVVDWKNMTPLKISDISELQVHDLIQFKIPSMNENGEPEISSVITARIEAINGIILHIQVLSGIKQFITNNSKFQIEKEDNLETYLEVVYNDLYEIYKLI